MSKTMKEEIQLELDLTLPPSDDPNTARCDQHAHTDTDKATDTTSSECS